MLIGEVPIIETEVVSLIASALRVPAPDGRSLIADSNARFTPGVTALLGPNGSGKSTLLRTMAGLHPVAGGSILLAGRSAGQNRRAYLDQLIYLPQNFVTYPDLTGREFLEYALQLRGAGRRQARDVAAQWLDAVGLRQAADTKTGAYSQGMRQRLGFAYAMQMDVLLYLMDEPFAGVDPESRNTMTDLLFAQCSERIVIVSTHHVDEMAVRGAAIVRIAEGRLVAE